MGKQNCKQKYFRVICPCLGLSRNRATGRLQPVHSEPPSDSERRAGAAASAASRRKCHGDSDSESLALSESLTWRSSGCRGRGRLHRHGDSTWRNRDFHLKLSLAESGSESEAPGRGNVTPSRPGGKFLLVVILTGIILFESGESVFNAGSSSDELIFTELASASDHPATEIQVSLTQAGSGQ